MPTEGDECSLEVRTVASRPWQCHPMDVARTVAREEIPVAREIGIAVKSGGQSAVGREENLVGSTVLQVRGNPHLHSAQSQ
jgi:hypothetical protein